MLKRGKEVRKQGAHIYLGEPETDGQIGGRELKSSSKMARKRWRDREMEG